MGNPPFNVNGIVKVPTQKNISKKTDGKMIWGHFTLHAIDFLKENNKKFLFFFHSWFKEGHHHLLNPLPRNSRFFEHGGALQIRGAQIKDSGNYR